VNTVSANFDIIMDQMTEKYQRKKQMAAVHYLLDKDLRMGGNFAEHRLATLHTTRWGQNHR